MALDGLIKVLARQRVLLADGNSRARGEMARYLRSVGMEVYEAGSVPEGTEAIRKEKPRVVAVDLDLPGDVPRCISLASERRDGEPSHVLVTCRPTTPKSRLVAVLTPAVGAVVLTPCRPEMMMERIGRMLGDPSAGGDSAGPVNNTGVSLVEGNNSLLLQNAVCPFHERETRAKRYALRMNRIEASSNFFDVPVYTRAVKGADYIDYHNLCVTVCPDCLFASADPAHFTLPHDRRHVTRPLTPTARYAIISRAHQRREMVGELSPTFFTEDRTAEEAVVSFELAIHCSQTLHNVAKHLYTDELVRQGNYHLRIAHLREKLGHSQAERDEHIQAARERLTEAFPSLPEAGIARSTYQVVATNLYMGNDREAHQYLSHLAKLSRQATNPTIKTAVQQYLVRSAKAWESREEHRRPMNQPPLAAPTPFLSEAA